VQQVDLAVLDVAEASSAAAAVVAVELLQVVAGVLALV